MSFAVAFTNSLDLDLKLLTLLEVFLKELNFVTRNLSQCDKCPQRHDFSRIEARGQGHSDLKTVCDPEYVTLCNPKVYPHTKFEIPTSYALDRIFLELRPGQGHSGLKIVCDTSGTLIHIEFWMPTSNNMGYAPDTNKAQMDRQFKNYQKPPLGA